MQFLLDENIHAGLALFLSKLGYKVKFVPKGFKNGAVFNLAVSKKLILITHDSDFADWTKFAIQKSFGILLIKISPENLDKIKLSLAKFLKEKTMADLKGKLFLVFADKVEEK